MFIGNDHPPLMKSGYIKGGVFKMICFY